MVEKSKYFWNNRSVLITGYEGFLGSNLTRKLFGYGAKTIGLDIKVNRRQTIFTKEDYKRITVVKGSVTDYKLLQRIIIKYKIKTVFHLAAEAIVGRALENPLNTFSSNVEGTWKVLEACRQSGEVKSIVVASSDKAYGSHKKLPYREDTSLLGNHPYDASKSCSDSLAVTYFHTYGLPVAITRCGNIYGPGDFNFSRIIPDAVRCALKSKTLFIRSDGKFKRDYVYIDDIVDGYIILAEKVVGLRLCGQAFNLSDESPISVLGLVKRIYKLAGKKPHYKILNKAKYEIRNQYLSSSKARKVLGWEPRYTLEQGLTETIEWYRGYFNKK